MLSITRTSWQANVTSLVCSLANHLNTIF
uniref:Uncharacterized protein n=1 Tax=Anguilla anguilla TaxID=7936 RepID=A0A0E9TAV4_ANGAN